MKVSVGILDILGIVFIVLKLCKVIDWSWVWVLCPIWGGLVLYGVGAAIYVIVRLRKGR